MREKGNYPVVVVPPDKAVGGFANAFRTVRDSGSEWFLDFLVYSEIERRADLVARVRVQEAFLLCIRDRLSATLSEIVETTKGIQVVSGGVWGHQTKEPN